MSRKPLHTFSKVLPYFWRYKVRVIFAISALLLAKLAGFASPIVLKDLINAMNVATVLVLPIGLLLAYGCARLGVTVFNELRELIFIRATQNTARSIALEVFNHLQQLSIRFHLERQTGGLTRDIERGTRAISSLVSYLLYSIFPTLVEISLVMAYMAWQYEPSFLLITGGALLAYIAFTLLITEWRTHLRQKMNQLDSRANTRAIDALINFETVKYFDNSAYELHRYDQHLQEWEQAAVRSQSSLSVLNLGQSFIVLTAVVLVMWRALVGMQNGTMQLGDLVLVNAFLLQLYIPLNFLGVLYREIRQGLMDLEKLFDLLEKEEEVKDAPHALPLILKAPHYSAIRFDRVSFNYEPSRQILRDVDLHVGSGRTVAIVGHSGAGKSTLVRLLFRFYDPQQGAITISDQNLKDVTQHSLRSKIGIVPQDTVLFNDTIEYNIRYARPDCSPEQLYAAARGAAIHDFIESLPNGYQTVVGERGLKLSGGEKQRVAIARALLKNAPILLLDEATAALDSVTEEKIQSELGALADGRTCLIIAHRLSTVTHADQIIVMSEGQVVESGVHSQLLANPQSHYALLWNKQRSERTQ